jgi:hypothetical protein
MCLNQYVNTRKGTQGVHRTGTDAGNSGILVTIFFFLGFYEDELRIPGRTPRHTVFKGGPAIVNAFIFTIRWEPTSFVTFLLHADDLKKSNTTDMQVRL